MGKTAARVLDRLAQGNELVGCRLKLNVFKPYEIYAFDLANARLADPFDPICFMLGDSLLSTHLANGSTILGSRDAAALYLRVMLSALHDLRLAIDARSAPRQSTFLLADMPMGSVDDEETASRNCDLALRYGADAVKLELYDDSRLKVLETLARRDIVVIGHIGYTPQSGGQKLRGQTLEDCLRIFCEARRAISAGAKALVIEGLSTIALEVMSTSSSRRVPIFSIFSGAVTSCIQSINIWDCVYKACSKARYFPPSARLSASSHPSHYSVNLISDRVHSALGDLAAGRYPLRRAHRMSDVELDHLAQQDPWEEL